MSATKSGRGFVSGAEMLLVVCMYGALELVIKLGWRRIRLVFLHGCGIMDGLADKKPSLRFDMAWRGDYMVCRGKVLWVPCEVA